MVNEIYVVIGILAGCLQEIHVFFGNRKAAEDKRDSMLKDYGLTDSDKPNNQHSSDCRWNDENEVHLHELQPFGFGRWSES